MTRSASRMYSSGPSRVRAWGSVSRSQSPGPVRVYRVVPMMAAPLPAERREGGGDVAAPPAADHRLEFPPARERQFGTRGRVPAGARLQRDGDRREILVEFLQPQQEGGLRAGRGLVAGG